MQGNGINFTNNDNKGVKYAYMQNVSMKEIRSISKVAKFLGASLYTVKNYCGLTVGGLLLIYSKNVES